MNIEIAKKRINSVIQEDTNANSEADFLATHIPFEGIKIRAGGSSVDEFSQISEDKLFDEYIKDPGDLHQLIVIYGSSGSGKSHLIRWFASKFASFEHESEAVLYIRRSDNTLKGTIRQLLELEEIQDIPNRDLYERLAEAGQNIGAEELKNKIYYTFLSKISSDEDTSILSRIEKNKLLALLSNQDFKEHFFNSTDFNGPIDRIYRKVVPSEHTKGTNDIPALFIARDFELDNDFILGMQEQNPDGRALSMAEKLNTYENGSNEKAEQIAKYLNRFVDNVIQELAGLQPGDFENVFRMVREELYRKHKNLTLLIEDITAFTGVNAALLNVLTDHHTGTANSNGHQMCRISSIIGTTTQYYNGFRDNFIQRISKEIFIEDDLLTKNQELLVRFVARYLNAMSLPEDELDQWLTSGADSQKLPIHTIVQGQNWDYTTISNGNSLPLYPFTKNAIYKLFNSLSEDKRTPRYVLSDVIQLALNNIISEPLRYPSFSINSSAITGLSSSEQKYIVDQVDPSDQKRLVSFICIWGDGSINDYTDDNGQRYLSGIKYEVFSEIGFPNIHGINGKAPIIVQKPTTKQEKNKEEKSLPTVTSQEKKDSQYDEASDMISRWALGDGLFEDSRNIYKKCIEDFVYSSIDWQSEGVSFDNAQRVKDYGLLEIQKSTRNTTGLFKIEANNENASMIDAFAKWLFIGKESWNYDDSGNDQYVITKWLYSNKAKIVELVKTYNGKNPVTYAEYAVSYYVYSMLIRGQELKTSDPGLILKSLVSVKAKDYNEQGVHCNEWNDFRQGFVTNEEAHDVVCSYYNLSIDDSSTKRFLCRSVADSQINKLLKNGFIIKSDEKDYISNRQVFIEKTRAIYPNIHKVILAEEKYAKEIIQIILEEMDLSDISFLGESSLSDLKECVLDYIASVKKADRQSCVNCIDTLLLKEISDNKDKVCSSAKQLQAAFLATDDFKKMVRFAKNPLLYLSKLATLLSQIKESIGLFSSECASFEGKSSGDDTSILFETKDEAVKQIDEAKKMIKAFGGDK